MYLCEKKIKFGGILVPPGASEPILHIGDLSLIPGTTKTTKIGSDSLG